MSESGGRESTQPIRPVQTLTGSVANPQVESSGFLLVTKKIFDWPLDEIPKLNLDWVSPFSSEAALFILLRLEFSARSLRP